MNRNDIFGIITYFSLSLLFGGATGMLALIIKEDSDRCHYYGGKWCKDDLVRGCAAVCIGMIIRYIAL